LSEERMTQKRAYIVLIAAALLLEVGLTVSLKLLGAGQDALVAAYLFLACGASLGIGLIGTHYD
jgi:hypothetical protein